MHAFKTKILDSLGVVTDEFKIGNVYSLVCVNIRVWDGHTLCIVKEGLLSGMYTELNPDSTSS